MREFVERLKADKRRRHAQVLYAIRSAPVAIAMTGRGRVTLAVVTPEMSRPSEGAWTGTMDQRATSRGRPSTRSQVSWPTPIPQSASDKSMKPR